MTNKKYDYLIYIGKFAPFHIGNKKVLKTALTMSEKVIMLVGSSCRPRTIQNPWTFIERANIIRSSISDQDNSRIRISPLKDYFYSEETWINQVQSIVSSVVHQDDLTNPKIGIICGKQSNATKYINLFPQWNVELHEEVVDCYGVRICGTTIRNTYFEQGDKVWQNTYLEQPTQNFLNRFSDTPKFGELVKEYQCIKKGKDAWKSAPYAPYFITVDSVVTQSGHILLVERGSSPGKGLLALPGGFLEQDEFIFDGALRELEEETKIDCPVKVLRGSLKGSHVFDHPLRSARGRTVTHAFHFELPPGKLPKVKGSDDAKYAMWVPFSELTSENMFEDHIDVITHFINIV